MDDTFKGYVASMRRHKYVMAFAIVVCVAAALWSAAGEKTTYTAAVGLGPSRSSMIERTMTNVAANTMSSITLARLSSDSRLAERVIARSEVDMTPVQLLGRITVEAAETGDIITIQVSDESAQRAMLLATTVAEELIASDAESRAEMIESARATIDKAMEERRKEAADLASRNKSMLGNLSPEEDVDLQRALSSYGYLAQRLDDLALATGGGASIEVWQEPRIVGIDSPRSYSFAVLGVIIGLVLGGAGAVAIDAVRTRTDSVEEFGRLLETEVIGAIPGAGPGSEGPAVDDEAWRLVEAKLARRLADEGAKSVVLAPVASDADTHAFVLSLATGLAGTGRSVVLVCAEQADRHAVQSSLGIEPDAVGLADVYRSEADIADVVRVTPVGGLWVVPGGRGTGVATNVPVLAEVVSHVARWAEVVLVLAGPLDASVHAVVALQSADCLAFIGAVGTPRAAVRRARNLLSDVKADVIGVLVYDSPLQGVGADA